jgi:hypothetical protein
MVQLSATNCSCITILCVSLVSSTTITLCVVSQQVFIVVVYFIIDSVHKLLDTLLYQMVWTLSYIIAPIMGKEMVPEMSVIFNVLIWLIT